MKNVFYPRPVGEQESTQEYQSDQQQQSYQQQNYQQQNYQQQNNSYEMPPSSNLIWGILTTLFCCLPLGIVSIVYASKVESLWHVGQKEAAYDASSKAKKWALWSALSAVILWFISIFFLIVLGFSGYALDSMNFH